MFILVFEMMLKVIDIFMMNSAYKSKLQKNMLGFINQYGDGVIKNVKIKRRYDEMMNKLRKEEI